MLQAERTQPCSQFSCYCRRGCQGIIRGNRDFNAVAVWITKPEGITHLRLAITLFQLDFNTRYVEASSKCSEFGICIIFDGLVMVMSTLNRVTYITCYGAPDNKDP